MRITEAAFSDETEVELARAHEFIANVEDPITATVLNFACMSVLENISYTRKDGQYLRWDYRAKTEITLAHEQGLCAVIVSGTASTTE